MNVLIVYAHPEPKSFCAALKNLAVSTLTEAGHNVQVSDLHAINFQAVASKEDFLELDNQDFFKYQVEQKIAYENEKLAPDIVAEQNKLSQADFVILNFPLWWFSVPAIMKGWVDRVFTTGFAYGGGKMYDRGGLKGKKAMLSLTTGGPASMYSSTGLNGEIEQILFPINHGILYFVGMEVLPPFIAWAPGRVGDEGRQKYLQEYKERLLNLDSIEPIKYRPLSDYDEELKLKSQ